MATARASTESTVPIATLRAFFDARVSPEIVAHPVLGTPCHQWTGTYGVRPNGEISYGQATVKGERWYAHRLAWHLFRPDMPIPEGMLVCHHCDNPRCVNVKHLFLGTDADNHQDKTKKGRAGRGQIRVERQNLVALTQASNTPAGLADRLSNLYLARSRLDAYLLEVIQDTGERKDQINAEIKRILAQLNSGT